jgi:hypothetical protein
MVNLPENRDFISRLETSLALDDRAPFRLAAEAVIPFWLRSKHRFVI